MDAHDRIRTSLDVPSVLEPADMPNERLRQALIDAGLDYQAVAEVVEVDPKTVERWVTKGREPYPKYRNKLAAMTGEREAYLWPEAYSDERRDEASSSELVRLYARRGHVPLELWERLLDRESEEIDVLVYAGLFLPEHMPDIADRLTAKAEAGARVRLMMGDPESDAVGQRGVEEGIGDALRARVGNAATYFRSPDHDAVERRLHGTTLYNSIFRFDDEMLVSAHVYGIPGAQAPVLHLKRIEGGELFATYQGAFERIWAAAVPAVGVPLEA